METKLRVIALTIGIFLLFASSVFSAPMSDEELHDFIVGVWFIEKTFDGGSIYGETLYNEDGTCVGRGKIQQGLMEKPINFHGTWHVDNGHVISETQNDSEPDRFMKTKAYRDKIEVISHDEINFVAPDGFKTLRHRATNPVYF